MAEWILVAYFCLPNGTQCERTSYWDVSFTYEQCMEAAKPGSAFATTSCTSPSYTWSPVGEHIARIGDVRIVRALLREPMPPCVHFALVDSILTLATSGPDPLEQLQRMSAGAVQFELPPGCAPQMAQFLARQRAREYALEQLSPGEAPPRTVYSQSPRFHTFDFATLTWRERGWILADACVHCPYPVAPF